MKMAVESMEMALGAIPRPGRVPKARNRDFSPPNFIFDGGSAAELFMDGCRFI
jgi:hypothetical protein